MDGRKGGGSTPSYKQAIVNRGEKPMEKDRGPLEGRQRNSEEERDGPNFRRTTATRIMRKKTRNKAEKTKLKKDHVNPKLWLHPEWS